jgi:hypothetical protein
VLRRRQRQAPREPAAVVPTTARLGSRPRRPAEPCGGVGTDTRQQQQHRNARHGLVVAPVRRAWLAVAAARARVRKGGKHLCFLELSVAA